MKCILLTFLLFLRINGNASYESATPVAPVAPAPVAAAPVPAAPTASIPKANTKDQNLAKLKSMTNDFFSQM